MLNKTFEPREVEERQYNIDELSGAFAASCDSKADPFTIMMPPPNVTGSLHMGHALNMTLQDILTRFHRMRGFNTLWQPGTDHAGIATQMVVERQLAADNVTRHDLGREKFLEKVWAWKSESGNTITGQLRRLGASPDWARERFTMDSGLSHAVTKVFVQLHKEGLIYKDKRLVNWDPKLHTAISDLEVENRDVKGSLWHFRYPLADGSGDYIVVATTRPETMLGDTAVAVHPDDERYQKWIGKTVLLPLVGREIPIVADDYADPEMGSGAVKITPAHDFNDFEVGRRHQLPLINIFDRDARLNDAVPVEYQGLDRFVAREKVVADLDSLSLLEKIEPHGLKVPHGDRSGVVIEPWLTDQWYCDAATLAKPAIEAVERGDTVFVPKNWDKTYFEWMNNIQPWCISRQLWWGHQIPAWYGPDGKVFVEENADLAQQAANSHYGKAVDLVRDEDVLDTWFSSALWPFSTLGWPDEVPDVARFYPGDVLVTGFDIIFFWVARMMMMGLHFMGKVPFKTVYIHALVRDEKGQKMSKSKGNIIDPLGLIDEYGADALRFTLTAMAAQGRDIKLAVQRVEGYRNFATKLWNATRFCQMNGCKPVIDFDPGSVQGVMNKWIIGTLGQMARQVTKSIEQYRFNECANALYQFVWGNFCDWYLEFSKPVFAGDDSAMIAETRATTAWVLDQLLVLMHPIMPFITQELRDNLDPDRPSLRLITAPWPEYSDSWVDQNAITEIDWLIRLVSTIRSVRSDMNVPASAEITVLLKGASEQTLVRVARYDSLIRRLARLAQIGPLTGIAPEQAAQALIDEAILMMPMAGIIDITAEINRLKKELSRLSGEIEKTDKKLANAEFMAKAPDDVVEEQRERRDEAFQAQIKLREALERLDKTG